MVNKTHISLILVFVLVVSVFYFAEGQVSNAMLTSALYSYGSYASYLPQAGIIECSQPEAAYCPLLVGQEEPDPNMCLISELCCVTEINEHYCLSEWCGDGICTENEEQMNCIIDCNPISCGDGFCESPETASNCEQDCCLGRTIAPSLTTEFNLETDIPFVDSANETMKEFSIGEGIGVDKIEIKKLFTESVAWPTCYNKEISSILVRGNGKILSEDGFARLTAIDTDGREWLVFGSDSLILENEFSFKDVCEETCNMDGKQIEYFIFYAHEAELKINAIKILPKESPDSENLQYYNTYKNIHDHSKLLRWEEKIERDNLEWQAGQTEISSMSFEEKKKVYRVEILPNLHGFEYYVDGIFGHDYEPLFPPGTRGDYVSPLPKNWDWRNVNGENWVTSVKNQGEGKTCYAFGAVGGMESYINLYYNRHKIDADLSEQMYVYCEDENADNPQHDYSGQISQLKTIDGRKITIEECVPYKEARREKACTSEYICNDWNEKLWEFSDIQKIRSDTIIKLKDLGDDGLKKLLIQYGPLEADTNMWTAKKSTDIPLITWLTGDDITKEQDIRAGHAMLLVGYTTDDDGVTTWIFKNSWGKNWGDNGYIKIKTAAGDRLGAVTVIKGPVIPPTNQDLWPEYFDNRIRCVDSDGDGYCWWGIAEEKPDTCPGYCQPARDSDDTDGTKGPFHEDFSIQGTTGFICGDGVCSEEAGENRLTCTIDCGQLGNGVRCLDDGDCESSHCVHGMCRPEDTYCGDQYCDGNMRESPENPVTCFRDCHCSGITEENIGTECYYIQIEYCEISGCQKSQGKNPVCISTEHRSYADCSRPVNSEQCIGIGCYWGLYCGDKYCSGDEDALSCPVDCELKNVGRDCTDNSECKSNKCDDGECKGFRHMHTIDDMYCSDSWDMPQTYAQAFIRTEDELKCNEMFSCDDGTGSCTYVQEDSCITPEGWCMGNGLQYAPQDENGYFYSEEWQTLCIDAQIAICSAETVGNKHCKDPEYECYSSMENVYYWRRAGSVGE